MYLRIPTAIGKPRYPYIVCGQLTKNKEKIQKFKEKGNSQQIYQNKPGKICFQDDAAYGDFKNLLRRKASDEISREKAFIIAKNPKYERSCFHGLLIF